MDDKKGGIGLLSIFGGGSPTDEAEDGYDEKDMACKAMFKAIKKDDYAGFKDALGLYMDAHGEDSETPKDEPDSDVDD